MPQVQKWPIFGVGGEAYKAIAYRFPERTVIGVPHPTGSHGHFAALFAQHNGDELRSPQAEIISAVNETLASAGTVWLRAESKSGARSMNEG
jgi:hypothetical protein